MRRAARIDANHTDICAALRGMGVHVTSLASVGNGVPDLLLSYRGRWYVAEIKDGSRKWDYTPAQNKFSNSARAEVLTFESIVDVINWANSSSAPR